MTQLSYEETGAFPRKFYVTVGDVRMWMVIHNHKEEEKAKKVQQLVQQRVEGMKKRLPQPYTTSQLILAVLLDVATDYLPCQAKHAAHLKELSQRLDGMLRRYGGR